MDFSKTNMLLLRMVTDPNLGIYFLLILLFVLIGEKITTRFQGEIIHAKLMKIRNIYILIRKKLFNADIGKALAKMKQIKMIGSLPLHSESEHTI